jgi:hypothetical protein
MLSGQHGKTVPVEHTPDQCLDVGVALSASHPGVIPHLAQTDPAAT